MEALTSVLGGVAGFALGLAAGLRLGRWARLRWRYWALSAAVLAIAVVLDAVGLSRGQWWLVVGAVAFAAGGLTGLKYGFGGVPVRTGSR